MIWTYTILPMLPTTNEININPVHYLEMMNSLGESGYELVTIYNDCLIFKKLCSDTEK